MRSLALCNVTSALVADQILFNSHFHRDVFFEDAPSFVNTIPDSDVFDWEELRAKSRVLQLG